MAANTMIRRVAAAQATYDAFFDREFAWGGADCVRMAALDLQRLGYKPKLSRGGSYASPLAAARALKRAGFASLAAALDDLGLPQIGHAARLPGDLLAFPSHDGWEALGVALGNGRALAISPHTNRFAVVQPPHEDILTCWKVEPWPLRS